MEKFAFSVVLEPQPEGGFTVTVPALPEVVTEGGSRRIRARRERLLPPLRALLPRYRMASPFRAKDAAWIRSLLARKPTKVAAVALANKTARIVYARPNPWIGQAQVNAGKVLRYNWTSGRVLSRSRYRTAAMRRRTEPLGVSAMRVTSPHAASGGPSFGSN